MHLGISSYSFPWAFGLNESYPFLPLTPRALLEYAAASDIHIVQFGDNCSLHKLTNDEFEKLADQAFAANINIQPGTRKLTLENLETYIAITSKLNAPYFRIVIDDENFWPGINEIIDIIGNVIPSLKAANVKIAIENHDRFPATVLKKIVESTDEKYVGICLDTANSLGAGEGVNEVLKILGPYTINLHIKDVTIKRLDHKMGFKVSGCIAGTGVLDIPYIVSQVNSYGRCDAAILEVWSDPELTLDETLRKERDWVAKSIEFLKTIMS